MASLDNVNTNALLSIDPMRLTDIKKNSSVQNSYVPLAYNNHPDSVTGMRSHLNYSSPPILPIRTDENSKTSEMSNQQSMPPWLANGSTSGDPDPSHHKSSQPNRLPRDLENSPLVLNIEDTRHQTSVKYHQKQPLVATALPSNRSVNNRNRVSGVHHRPSLQRFSGICFLVVVTHIIVLQYIAYASLLLRPLVYPNWNWYSIAFVSVFHILFGLTVWSFIQCVATDAGTVPLNWGFYMGDKNKRRRYCQVCNIWKPDRTHHCSACDRCILNMDHHCPWINNCVGFYNRKFFIQLLCTSLASLLWVSTHCLVVIFLNAFTLPNELYAWANFIIIDDSGGDLGSILQYCLFCLMMFISVALAFPLIPFLRFHIGLMTRNSTTIECMPSNIDVRQGDRQSKPCYDIGTRRNIEQVLGRNSFLWFVPIHLPASRPVGDGVRWRQSYLTAIEEDAQRAV